MFKVLSFIAAFTSAAIGCDTIHTHPEQYSSVSHAKCGLVVVKDISERKCHKLDGVFVKRKTEQFCSIIRFPKEGK